MTEATPFPISSETKGLTGRDGYIVEEALYLATQWIDHMSDQTKLDADKRAMLRILNAAYPDWEDIFGPP